MTRVIDSGNTGVSAKPTALPVQAPSPSGLGHTAGITNADDLPDFPQGFDEIYHERMIYDERYSEN